MNAKRQTIWLVSMLSLMVVLSAYYLFTEDVNKLNVATVDTTGKPQDVKIDMSQIDNPAAGTSATNSDAAKSTTSPNTAKSTTSPNTAKSTTSPDASKSAAGTDASKTSSAAKGADQATANANTDAKVLQKVAETQAQAASASDYFTTQQMKNHEELQKKTEQLMTTITDPKQKADAVVKAQNDLQLISGQQEKIDNLEEMLLKDYPQAVISQEGKGWKVTVQSQKLEKSQGVSIVDMVIKELGAAPENIKIQYIQP
ncbi:SpoIIIAH-like family protein [Paenibacillus sp. GP183]|uniref:SpoIIIAH-like family protein n=1 Tax=Paenibacillus sp. GP183 TaxID=1882751 RepID=UPI00089B74ED|nr:SpoIIIAH-like family protein [Paenibacillus sp. GP183]SEB69313.1 stage III sporulation protein AH [Paenibacillus sp. GP183]